MPKPPSSDDNPKVGSPLGGAASDDPGSASQTDGNLGTDPSAGEPAPSATLIKVGDKEYTPEQLVEAHLKLEEQHGNLETVYGRQSRELGQYRQNHGPINQGAPAPTSVQTPKPGEGRKWTDPLDDHDAFGGEVAEAAAQAAYDRIKRESQRERDEVSRIESALTTFQEKNPQFDHPDGESVLLSYVDTMSRSGQYSDWEFSELLVEAGKRVDKALLGVAKAQMKKGGSGDEPTAPHVEGGGGPIPSEPAETKKKTLSYAEQINQYRQKKLSETVPGHGASEGR